MTTEELLAELKNTLKSYDSANLLDEISIRNWVKNALKEFGANVMVEEEATIEVINGKAKLPDNFWGLRAALKCEAEGVYTECEEEEKTYIQSSIFKKERLEKSYYFTNLFDERPCLEGVDCKHVIENITYTDRTNKKRRAELFYGNFTWLKLVKGVKKSKCLDGCENLTVRNSPYEISVDNFNYINTNFNSGFIYIRYKGIPVDENGDIYIPETDRGILKEYIQYTCKRRILENLWLNNDDVNVGNKLQYFTQKENQTYQQAMSEVVSKAMIGWPQRVKNQNRLRTAKVEALFSSI